MMNFAIIIPSFRNFDKIYCLDYFVCNNVGHMNISFEGSAVHGRSIDIIVQTPQKDVFHVVIDMELNLFRWNTELRVDLVVNKPKFLDKLFPELLIYLRNFCIQNLVHYIFVIVRRRKIWSNFSRTFKASFVKSFFPRMKVYA